MIQALYRPMRSETVLLVAAGLAGATALYCLLYNLLAGRNESVADGLLWALVNVLPWYVAFETAKRAANAAAIAAALAVALAGSMLLHILLFGMPAAPGFELMRRIPSALLVLGLVATGRLFAAGKAAQASTAEGLPLAPTDFDWVSAAGNYVELRRAGRAVLHRAPLSAVHAELERHGFIRIHRSTLVRRERIARVRPNDVLLHDGTSLKTGKRYRSTLH